MRSIGAGSSAAVSTAVLGARPSSFAHEERYYERQRQRHMRAQVEADAGGHSSEFGDDSRGSSDTEAWRMSSDTSADVDNSDSVPLSVEASYSQPILAPQTVTVQRTAKPTLSSTDVNKLLKSPFPSSSRRSGFSWIRSRAVTCRLEEKGEQL